MIDPSKKAESVKKIIATVFGLIAGAVGGGLIPVQGRAGIGLADFMGGSYAALALSTTTSLGISGSIFGMISFYRWRLARHRRDDSSAPHFGRLLRRPLFYISGLPGALYMTVYQGVIDLAGFALATVGAMCGIVGFPIYREYRELRGEGLSKRDALTMLRRKIKGIAYMLLATLCFAGIYAYTSDAIGDSFAYAFVMIAFGAGIAWQFSILGDMYQATGSLTSAALMSSLSGFATGVCTTAGFIVAGQDVLFRWPTEVGDLWMYGNGLSGVGIIALGTYATVKIGKPSQVFMMAFGSLVMSLVLADTAHIGVVISLQILAYVLGIRGVYLCVISAEMTRRIVTYMRTRFVVSH